MTRICLIVGRDSCDYFEIVVQINHYVPCMKFEEKYKLENVM